LNQFEWKTSNDFVRLLQRLPKLVSISRSRGSITAIHGI